jgi:hypothetical protein
MHMKTPLLLIVLTTSVFSVGCTSPGEWWKKVNLRASELKTIRVRYQVLEAELTALKGKHLELENRFTSLQAELEMSRERKENLAITGHESGRHLANIKTVAPKDLSMKERSRLAQEHFARGKFEAAYGLYESFLWQPEGGPFQTVDAFYGAGISAYQIKNFNRAREYFEAVNTHGNGLRDQETLRRTALWLRILNKQDGRKVASHE